MPSGSRDTEFRNNCIQIAEYNSKKKCSRIPAQPSKSRKQEQQRIGFRQTKMQEIQPDSGGDAVSSCAKATV